MSQHRVLPTGKPLRSYCGLFAIALLGGCYQGEWRLGVDVPVATTNRLIPTRDIERWELAPSTMPNVVQVRASVSPRCRYALYGTVRRTDTGQFRRTGGSWWTALSIVTGTAGGAASGFGGAGWFSNLYPEWGRPVMYGTGSALAAGGLISCISALARPTKLRFAMCGILVGLGGSMLAGTGMSTIPAAGSLGSTPSSPGFVPLIDVPTFRTIALTGAGLVGASIFTGIVGGTWRGHIDRERVVDSESAQSWDAQSGEQNCGTNRPMAGRTVALEVTSEYLTEGLGSEAAPLKVRVALGGQSSQTVDLRGLRQALPSCGSLHVQLAPDIMYEMYSDDYLPPVPPDQLSPSSRPIHGTLKPREGLWLAPPSALGNSRRGTTRPTNVPGIASEILAEVERRCRGDMPSESSPQGPLPNEEAPRKEVRRATARQAVEVERPVPVASVAPVTPPAVVSEPERQPAASDETFNATPGLTPQRRPLSRSDNESGECSSEAQQARFADCEHQCGRALELSACLFTFRKCHINARGTALPQKERDACDLAWEQCLFNANIAPGSWRRCVDGCVQANEPATCKSKN